MSDVVRAVHMLLGYAHLEQAGVRRMTNEERELLLGLSLW